MGPNRQVEINGSKKMASKIWVKLTDLKKQVQIGGSKSKLKYHQNGNVPKTEISQ